MGKDCDFPIFSLTVFASHFLNTSGLRPLFETGSHAYSSYPEGRKIELQSLLAHFASNLVNCLVLLNPCAGPQFST